MGSMRALLLNSSYEPMRIVSWQKALVLWFQGKVEILDYHPVFARSMRASFQIPSVLRLKSYVRPKNNGIRFCRENVYLRDNYTCQYCGIRFPSRLLTLDHVVPASHNGRKSWDNVVAACRDCNQRKANRTPDRANMPLLSTPVIPTWLPSVEFELISESIPNSWLQYIRMEVSY
jgi:5-methylcytosine-specific restriction endonuclease McrA